MICRTLLKSCATPPVSLPTASRRCARCSAASALRRSFSLRSRGARAFGHHLLEARAIRVQLVLRGLRHRHVVALHEDADDLAHRVDDLLDHDVDVDRVRAVVAVGHPQRETLLDDRHAADVDRVEQLDRDRRLAAVRSPVLEVAQVFLADHLQVRRVGELDDVLGLAHEDRERQRLVEQLHQPSMVEREQAVLGLDGLGTTQQVGLDAQEVVVREHRRTVERLAVGFLRQVAQGRHVLRVLQQHRDVSRAVEQRMMRRAPQRVDEAVPFRRRVRDRIADQRERVRLAEREDAFRTTP